MTVYRTMTPEDIPVGLNLCRLAGWNQLARDWDLFLQKNKEACSVAVDDAGKVIGTVATIPYQDHFTWIGMVLVDPSKQRQGIGTGLLHEALRLTANQETIKLDATPAGREVYLKLGFSDEYEIIRMSCVVIKTRDMESTARLATASDFPSLLKLDLQVFGADRQFVLEWNFKDAGQYAFVVEEHGQITGFCLGRRGYDFDQIGPIVADDVAIGMQLLSSVLHEVEGKPVILDVLTHTSEWLDFVSTLGFTPLRPLIRMFRGPNNYPGLPQKQFAILGPEFG